MTIIHVSLIKFNQDFMVYSCPQTDLRFCECPAVYTKFEISQVLFVFCEKRRTTFMLFFHIIVLDLIK